MFGQQHNDDTNEKIPDQSIDGVLSSDPITPTEPITPVDTPTPTTDSTPDSSVKPDIQAPETWQHPGAQIDEDKAITSAPAVPATPAPEPTPSPSPDPTSAPDPSIANDLIDIKQKALSQLMPLVGHLDQTPEEKFRTTMMMLQASDDQSLVNTAYEAANQIEDEKTKAQALLDIVNEINYFTSHHTDDKA